MPNLLPLSGALVLNILIRYSYMYLFFPIRKNVLSTSQTLGAIRQRNFRERQTQKRERKRIYNQNFRQKQHICATPTMSAQFRNRTDKSRYGEIILVNIMHQQCFKHSKSKLQLFPCMFQFTND